MIAIVLALGFAARGGMLTRMLAAAALVPIAPTLYLTFSRGALVGLAVGLVALVALDRNRVQLIVGMFAGSIGAVGALLAVHGHPALTKYNRDLADQATQGAQTAARMISLIPLAMGAARAALGARGAVHRVALRPHRRRRRHGARGLRRRRGGRQPFRQPDRVRPRRGAHAREARADVSEGRPQPAPAQPLAQRPRPLLEGGLARLHRAPRRRRGRRARSRDYWNSHRQVKIHAKHAHSLYLETLAELGVVGLAILLVALVPPLWTGLRRRAHPMSAPVMAGLIAFLVHTGGDWTWQLPGVALAAIACAAACIGLVVDAERDPARPGRPLGRDRARARDRGDRRRRGAETGW